MELVFECILMISFAKNIQVYFQRIRSTDLKCINLRVINGSYKCIRRAMSYWKRTHDWVQQEQSQDFDLRRKEKAVVGRIRLGLCQDAIIHNGKKRWHASQPLVVCSGRSCYDLRPLYQEIVLNCEAPHSAATCSTYTGSNIKLHMNT